MERFGGLVDVQPAKEPHLDNLTFSRIDFGKRGQCIVDGDEIVIGFDRNDQRFVKRKDAGAGATLLIAARPRGIDENSPHQPCRHGKEMRAILPLHLSNLDEPQVGLVDERGCLQGVTVPLPAHVVRRQPPQLVVDERQQRLECRVFAAIPGEKQVRWRRRVVLNAVILRRFCRPQNEGIGSVHLFANESRLLKQEEADTMANRVRSGVRGIAFVLAVLFFLQPSTSGQGQSGQHTLTCGPEKTIGNALKTLQPGDTLLVSGTCKENLVVGPEIQRITLDGQGTAVIEGDNTASAVTISGRGITFRGFKVIGGAPQGVGVLDGGAAILDGNTIEFADRNGIAIFRNSYADILNNTVQNNPVAGIAIQYDSSARVGWFGPPNARVSAPNTIQNNGGAGLQITRGSSAQIFNNQILNNASDAVVIDRNAQAEVGANLIAGNGRDAIRVMRNSGVDIGTDVNGSTPTFDDDTNTGTNAGFAVNCSIGGFVDGRFGSLAGLLGLKRFAEGCIDSSQ